MLVIFSVNAELLPTVTLPKLRLAGLAPSVPCETPVPDKGIVRVGLEPFDVTVTLPLALPAEAGAKVTVKLVLCPAVNVTGVEAPLRVKPVPLMVT